MVEFQPRTVPPEEEGGYTSWCDCSQSGHLLACKHIRVEPQPRSLPSSESHCIRRSVTERASERASLLAVSYLGYGYECRHRDMRDNQSVAVTMPVDGRIVKAVVYLHDCLENQAPNSVVLGSHRLPFTPGEVYVKQSNTVVVVKQSNAVVYTSRYGKQFYDGSEVARGQALPTDCIPNHVSFVRSRRRAMPMLTTPARPESAGSVTACTNTECGGRDCWTQSAPAGWAAIFGNC